MNAAEGLGLGLAMVWELVELHGGTVRADSAGPGTGAAFTVTFPSSDTTASNVPAENTALVDGNKLRNVHIQRVPAIAVSAFTNIQTQHSAFVSGFDAHVAKPVDIIELEDAIFRLQRPADVAEAS